MPQPYHPVDTQHVLFLLRQWLKAASSPEAVDWLDGVRDAVNDGLADGEFFTAYAAVPRQIGRAPLRLSAEDRAEAERACPGWRPDLWSAETAARAALLLVYDDSDAVAYGTMLASVLRSGNLEGAIAVFRSLPLLPYPERHIPRAIEAVRADDPALFAALALHNPYPARHFDEHAWNLLAMKAVMLGAPLSAIEGLERRGNALLAHQLRDFARSQRSGGGQMPAGIWQAAGPHVAGPLVDELAADLDGKDADLAAGAALALSASRDPRAAEALARRPDLQEAVRSGRVTWDRLSLATSRAAE